MTLRIKTEEERIDEDFSWLTKNTARLQKKYGGKWIAIVKKKIVGVGKTAVEASKKAQKKYPLQKALLGVVPTEECLIL